jgi:twitching motility protein PilT
MAEIILGAGRQKNIQSIVQIAEAELQKSQGSARRLIVRGAGIEISATRHGFDGPFESFAVRLNSDRSRAQTFLQDLAARHPGLCSTVEVEGGSEFRCHSSAAGNVGVDSVLDELSAHLHLPEVWRVHGEDYRHGHLSMEGMFRLMVQNHASDLHLSPGARPLLRVDNQIRTTDFGEPLSAEQILRMIREVAHDHDWDEFQTRQQCSFNFHQVGLGYSRISAFIKATVPHCTIRFLPETIPSFEDLHIPRDIMETLGSLDYGLILITGMTGSGKSTTVASLLEWLNENEQLHIITIEEPVEYVHQNRKSIVSQRDVGVDVPSFAEAVRGALRHDPDVIFIGEMRDQDTIRAAISAASTGHLVISTLHSNTSAEVVNRIVSFFDPVERDLIRLQLRDAMKCVICQRLLPRVGGGRIPALEFLFSDTKHLNDCILAGDTVGIRTGMQQGLSRSSIFEESLLKLFQAELISLEEGRLHSSSREVFEQMRLGTYKQPSLEPGH